MTRLFVLPNLRRRKFDLNQGLAPTPQLQLG